MTSILPLPIPRMVTRSLTRFLIFALSTLDLSSLEMISLHHLPLNLCFTQINNHYNVNINPNMTIEKLQKVATSRVMAEYKACWLRWWNSSRSIHQGNHFPAKTPFKDKTFDAFLNRASFWAQVFLTFLYFFLPLIIFIVLILTTSYSLIAQKGHQL